jgi:hypothetical protein
MGNAAVDGAAEIEPAAGAMEFGAPQKPRAHAPGEPLGQVPGAGDFVVVLQRLCNQIDTPLEGVHNENYS